MGAIFLVGEQRSGSNLIRLILNESPSIAGPHPPHILQRFMPLLPIYGNLTEGDKFDHLIDDVCRLVELNPVSWEGVKLDRQKIRNQCKSISLVAIYGAIMDIYAESRGADSWICKSMQNIRWAADLNEYFENPKYIYLYRDPRDVTASFMKAVIGDKHPYFIAKKWTELQKLCLEFLNPGENAQFFSVCYEKLVTNPNEVVKNLCGFLDIEFDVNMLSFHKSAEAIRTAESSQLWENLTRPINQNNSMKYLKELSENDIRIIESVAGEVMDVLGYERRFIDLGEERMFDQQQIAEFDDMNRRKIKQMECATDPTDLKRRGLQEQLIHEVKNLGRAYL